MAIPDSDPRAQELDAAFAAAHTAPQKPRVEAKTPADIDREAPHGRGEDGSPLAPFGLTKDGRIKMSNGGRPARNSPDRARTRTVDPAEIAAAAERVEAKEAKKKPDPHDWTEDLDGLADSAWFGLSAASAVIPHVPFLGKLLPQEKIAAQAFILSETKPRLVAAVNLAAQHNAKAEKFCKSLEGGDGLWALTCMFMVMPIVSVSATIWKGDEKELQAADLPSLKKMAELNSAKMDETVSRINAQITAATQPPPDLQAEGDA